MNLVDPDNRRPVDYSGRREVLSGLMNCTSDPHVCIQNLLEHRSDGRIKLFAIHRALGTRARLRDTYEQGEYIPLPAGGPRRECLFAFARRHADAIAITCVPRLVASLVPDVPEPPIGEHIWTDTHVILSGLRDAASGRCWRNAFTGRTFEAERRDDELTIPAAAMFEQFPIALLTAN